MIYYPKKQPKTATLWTVAAIFSAALFYTLGELGIGYRAVFQCSALLLFAVAILLMSRYLLTDYKYVISDASSASDNVKFVIIKVSGKREVEMAKYDMTEIYAAGRFGSVKAFEAAHGNVNKYFNYCTNLAPKNSFFMAMTFNGMKILFRIECDAAFEKEILRITEAGK